MPDILLAAGLGLIMGVLINALADRLPLSTIDFDIEEEEAPLEKSRHEKRGEVGGPVPSLYGALMRVLSGGSYQRPAFAGAVRYPLVEVIAIGLTVYIVLLEGFGLLFAIKAFYNWLFILIAVIDIEHRLILNVVMFPAFFIALVEVIFVRRLKFADALIGYAAAQIIVMGFYLMGYIYLWIVNSNRDDPVDEIAFGFGDVTLATFCGLVVGNPGVYSMLLLMVFFGAVSAVGTVIIFALLRGGHFRAHMAIPYGPSIVLGAAVMLLSPGEQLLLMSFM